MDDLRAFRKRRKLTQKRLGEILGYSHAYISGIENGRERASENFLEKLQEEFGESVAEIKSIVVDALEDYNNKWRRKYEALDKDYQELMKKHIVLLERLAEYKNQ